MKKILSLLLVLLASGVYCALSEAVAETISDDEYTAIICDCGEESCSCFIQKGDIGNSVRTVINILTEKGFLNDSHRVDTFDDELELAVKEFQKANDLEQTGMLNDETLTLLLWDKLPEELNKENPDEGMQVWIPTDGGVKRHRVSTCSSMLDPRKVSLRNAKYMGFYPCETCCPN